MKGTNLKEKGITLIALVITIVILLILAGVTISIVMNDGLIEKSENAVDKYSYEQEKEEEMLAELGKYINNLKVPIYTADQLKMVGTGETVKISEKEEYTFNMDANYVLMNDIKLNEGKYSVGTDGEITFNADAEQWTPIGTEENPFIGNFNGNGHTISGLYINSTSDNQGLFGVVESGTIENLTISGKISGQRRVGGIAGGVTGSKIIKINNCYNLCNIFGVANIGGIIGYNENANIAIKNCNNKGNIESKVATTSNWSVSGGICGEAGPAIISHCYNEGKIEGNGVAIGGIAGEQRDFETNKDGLIEYCDNRGDVASISQCVGGIVGSKSKGSIISCYNVGTITSTVNYIGGIVGENGTGTVNLCYNTGDVEGKNGIGGIAGYTGYTNKAIITNSYNTGSIKTINEVKTGESNGAVGGICGLLSNGDIENCYNIGTVNYSDDTLASGILGRRNPNGAVASYEKNVSNCYYLTGKASGGIDGVDKNGEAESKTSDQMKVASFVTTLNNGEDNWTIVSSKNDGYPILKWQK